MVFFKASKGSLGMATAPNPSKPFALWLRTRLVKELPLCSPRQLASALLDLGALKLLDDSSLLQIQREVTRNWRSNNMRPRDLASIISAYSKLEGVPARQAAIEPLLPQMLEMMSTLSGASLCELLHGFASANIYDRVLLDEWSDHFAAKVLGSPEGPARYALSPAELSLAVADLAKLRYVKKDTRRSFSALLEQVVDVAPSLGGLAVCHVVCALARVSPATTPTTPTTFTTLATPSALVDSSAAEFRSALLNRLEAQILVKVEELRPQGLSASAAAFVKLRHFSEGLLSGLTAAAATRFASFSAEDFSMFSSAIGTAQQSLAQGWCENHLELLGEHAASALQQGSSAWTPRQVSQVLHPFVAQKRPPQDLIHAAVSHLRKTSTNYSPRDLAKLLSNLHGCGVLHRDAAVAADILQSSERRLRHRGPEIVAVANSLAQLRQVIPVSQLRYRFRRLSISVQLALARNLLSLQDQADVLRIWALVGLRDWRLLAALATNASQAMEAAATKLLTGLGQLPFPAEDLPQAVYAYVKLGAPDSVQPKYRDSILEFLVRAMKALLQVDAVPRLGERALRQLLLGIAFWGPPKRTSPPLESDADSQAGELRQALLKQSLDSWLQLESCNLTGETARMVVASASMEFGVQAAELTAAAATRFRQVQRPQHAVAILSQSMNDLQSYERSVFKALEKLLAARCKAPGPPAVVGQFMAPCCDVRLAVPAWEVAVEVGLKNHLFEGPREAWAEGSEGWGRNPESELDHGPIPGDFIGDEMLEDEQSWFNVDGGEGLDASPGIPWQQLPALRIRLLRASGWKVIEIPYYDWRKLGKLEQQKFLGQLLKPYLSAPMQRIE